MLIIIRGAGDLASGVILKLYNSGFKILALEIEKPSAIRRSVSFSECIYKDIQEIEGVISKKVSNLKEMEKCWENFQIPVIIDPKGEWIEKLKPDIVVDAILAKKNMGTKKNMGKFVIGLGPGFTAPKDVDAVVETMRGHRLGQTIYLGEAEKNTGVPGEVKGISKERVIYSENSGIFNSNNKIGDILVKNETIGYIDNKPVKTEISGLLRGIIPNGYFVKKGLKIADIDPREAEKENCYTISDKARALGGAVLEIILKKIIEGERKNGVKYITRDI